MLKQPNKTGRKESTNSEQTVKRTYAQAASEFQRFTQAQNKGSRKAQPENPTRSRETSPNQNFRNDNDNWTEVIGRGRGNRRGRGRGSRGRRGNGEWRISGRNVEEEEAHQVPEEDEVVEDVTRILF